MLSIHLKLYFWVENFILNLYNFSCMSRKKVEQKISDIFICPEYHKYKWWI
jgi:hypothetical protein